MLSSFDVFCACFVLRFTLKLISYTFVIFVPNFKFFLIISV